MDIFNIIGILQIIVDYISIDVICKNVLQMDWDPSVISNLNVSYLSYITKLYPNKIDYNLLATNPNLSPDLIDKVKHLEVFKSNPFYLLNKPESDWKYEGLNGYVWRNPLFPYEQLMDLIVYPVDWEHLGYNQSLSHSFLKDHQTLIGFAAISEHPNSGDLLLNVIKYGDIKSSEMTLSNPGFPFGNVNFDHILNDSESRGTNHYVNEFYLLSNKKLPLNLIKKYGYIGDKMDPLIYENHDNIRYILKEYPPVDNLQKRSLLMNPAYYTYCVENELMNYLTGITFMK